MKKNLLTSFSGIFLLLIVCVTARGQLASTGIQPSEDFVSSGKAFSKNVLGIVDRNSVNSKAVKNFVKSFKDVSDEKWLELKDGFVAKFAITDINYQVVYDKKGKWVYTIRTYGETKLSGDVRHLVKSTYYDYGINLVQEIETPANPVIYVIQLLGEKEIISLRIYDGEMQVFQKFNKSE